MPILSRLPIFLVLAPFLAGCGNRQPAETAPPQLPPAFDAAAAYGELENIVAFGSRAHGSTGHDFMGGYLRARLSAMGYDTAIQTFTNDTPLGPRIFRNITASRAGTGDDIVILSTHYDSMRNAAPDFEAANAAGSGPAVLLELARIVNEAYEGAAEIRFVFFDGQEPMVRHSPGDGLYGSRYYADRLVENAEGARVRAVINLNMVGDRDLNVTVSRSVDNDLRRELLRAARDEQARNTFMLFPHEIGDDHDPFFRARIPSINIIDFHYGSKPGRNDYWRTPQDTLDKISADSLDIVGRVTLRLVWNLTQR